MKVFLAIILFLFLALQFAVAGEGDTASTTQDTVSTSYSQVFDHFMDLKAAPSQTAEIKDFTFRRDVAEFYLKKGKLHLCETVVDRICAAVFKGEGYFRYSPPTRIEKEQLARFYDKDSLEKKFSTLVIIFADSTLAEFQKRLTFKGGRLAREAQASIDYALKYLYRGKGKVLDASVLKTLLDEEYNDLFYAHFSKKKISPMFFEINPYSKEEIRFMRRLKGPSYLYVPEVINQFHKQQDYVDSLHLGDEEENSLHIQNYVLDCTLKGSRLKFSASAKIDFKSLKGPQNWLLLQLYEKLKVDSVFWGDGSKAVFKRKKDNPFLWIKCKYPMQLDDTGELTIYYHGDLIERFQDWFYIQSSRNWYPKHGLRHRASYDITYHFPDEFDFSSVGKMISREETDKQVTTRWVSQKPMHNAAFNIGFFKEYRIENDTIPPITIQISEAGHREIARSWGAAGLGSGSNMEKEVGRDIAGSIKLFQEIFGKNSAEHFYATDIPFTHGEAFPGFMHLSWQTFQMTSEKGDDHIFRAHEAAHQWWGIGVDFKTYHDQWLSEGFSEYSGWWYWHEVVKKEEDDEKKFYELLKKKREQIVKNRKFFLSDGQKAGPIWLGYRTLSSETRGDYRLIIYQKGAWVLHMLRMMYQDLETQTDDRFIAMLSGFYQQYLDQKVSTEDFIRFAEHAIGEDLGWFFDQWVFGTGIPKYAFSHNIIPTEDGQFQAIGRVRQLEVPAEFKMPVIIGVDFGDDNITSKRITVTGEVTEFDLGVFPEKPKKLIFNHLESVLCEIDNEKWKEKP